MLSIHLQLRKTAHINKATIKLFQLLQMKELRRKKGDLTKNLLINTSTGLLRWQIRALNKTRVKQNPGQDHLR